MEARWLFKDFLVPPRSQGRKRYVQPELHILIFHISCFINSTYLGGSFLLSLRMNGLLSVFGLKSLSGLWLNVSAATITQYLLFLAPADVVNSLNVYQPDTLTLQISPCLRLTILHIRVIPLYLWGKHAMALPVGRHACALLPSGALSLPVWPEGGGGTERGEIMNMIQSVQHCRCCVSLNIDRHPGMIKGSFRKPSDKSVFMLLFMYSFMFYHYNYGLTKICSKRTSVHRQTYAAVTVYSFLIEVPWPYWN